MPSCRPEFSPWIGPVIAAFYVGVMWMRRRRAAVVAQGGHRSRRARAGTAAELATARERLRLADDLHDILGHALEVVAFKSELAARLQSRPIPTGPAPRWRRSSGWRASRSARSAALVRETRSTDLVTELAGARAVLDSAGVELVVHGDPATVGPTARNVFGRVLREAMTNVLRHAEPSRCTIEIDVTDGDARLLVVNDGAGPGERGRVRHRAGRARAIPA